MDAMWRLRVEQCGMVPERQQSTCMGWNALPHPGSWPSGGGGNNHHYAEVSAPLGIHLNLAMKDTIWKREYIDIFSAV